MSYLPYYSQAVEEKMEKAGYSSCHKNGAGEFFKSPVAAMSYAAHLRTIGFYARAFACSTRVYDAPDGIVFFKKKTK